MLSLFTNLFTTQFKTVGTVELVRALQSLDHKLRKDLAMRATRRANSIVFASILSRTPVATGVLKKKLKERAGKRGKYQIAQLVATPTREQIGLPASAPYYPYAALIFGHSHPKKSRRGTRTLVTRRRRTGGPKHVKGVPFMQEGFDAVETAAGQVMISELWSGITGAWNAGY